MRESACNTKKESFGEGINERRGRDGALGRIKYKLKESFKAQVVPGVTGGRLQVDAKQQPSLISTFNHADKI